LSSAYPLLARFLRIGFPLGDFPTLHKTKIYKNGKSSQAKPELLWEYIKSEAALGCFSGPFSQSVCERILRGHFVLSPLVIVTTLTSEGATKNRVCRHLSKADDAEDFPAINDYIVKDDFPTHFGTAQSLADTVSSFFRFVGWASTHIDLRLHAANPEPAARTHPGPAGGLCAKGSVMWAVLVRADTWSHTSAPSPWLGVFVRASRRAALRRPSPASCVW
jgi:hypothetical protein